MKRAVICLLLCAVLLTGCGAKKQDSFPSLRAICELATLRCYYHNVAKFEQEESGWLGWLGDVGKKKMWLEYSGVVDVGIDASLIRISPPDESGVVEVYLPPAKVLTIDFDLESISDPLTETGWFTSISLDEKTDAFSAAQAIMEEAAQSDQALLLQARERAMEIIEQYIISTGELVDKTYTVRWVEE